MLRILDVGKIQNLIGLSRNRRVKRETIPLPMTSSVSVTNVQWMKVQQCLLSKMESHAISEMKMSTKNMGHLQNALQMAQEERISIMCTKLKVRLVQPSISTNEGHEILILL